MLHFGPAITFTDQEHKELTDFFQNEGSQLSQSTFNKLNFLSNFDELQEHFQLQRWHTIWENVVNQDYGKALQNTVEQANTIHTVAPNLTQQQILQLSDSQLINLINHHKIDGRIVSQLLQRDDLPDNMLHALAQNIFNITNNDRLHGLLYSKLTDVNDKQLMENYDSKGKLLKQQTEPGGDGDDENGVNLQLLTVTQRRNVAENTSTPVETLKQLGTDKDKYVRSKAETALIRFTPKEQLTKDEMKERGFPGKKSFTHESVSTEQKVPGYTLNVSGTDWSRYISADVNNPFPKELFDAFNLHAIPVDNAIGWIGGKVKDDTLYVTEMQSDLLQRTFELSDAWLDKNNYGKDNKMRQWTQYKSKIENYFKGWQYVFFNQAVKEAKARELDYIAVPTGDFYKRKHKDAPYQYYDRIVQNQPHTQKGNWYILPVKEITTYAVKLKRKSMKKVAFDKTHWDTYIRTYIDTFVQTQKKANPGIATDKELVQDAISYMLGGIPDNVKTDPAFIELLNTFMDEHKLTGLEPDDFMGVSDESQYSNDDNQGTVDPQGNPIDDFDDGSEELLQNIPEPNLNELLDEYSKAKESGDTQRIKSIEQALQELTSSNKFAAVINKYVVAQISKKTAEFKEFTLKTVKKWIDTDTMGDTSAKILTEITEAPDDKAVEDILMNYFESDFVNDMKEKSIMDTEEIHASKITAAKSGQQILEELSQRLKDDKDSLYRQSFVEFDSAPLNSPITDENQIADADIYNWKGEPIERITIGFSRADGLLEIVGGEDPDIFILPSSDSALFETDIDGVERNKNIVALWDQLTTGPVRSSRKQGYLDELEEINEPSTADEDIQKHEENVEKGDQLPDTPFNSIVDQPGPEAPAFLDLEREEEYETGRRDRREEND